MKHRSLIFFAVLATASFCQQISGQQASFEVAAVKPAAPNDTFSNTTPNVSPHRLEFRNATLRTMIYWAYGTGLSTGVNVSGGPDWINRNRYTIEATAERNPTDRDYRAMLRSLLEERFALKVHRESREIDVYALLPAGADGKPGPKVKPWNGTCVSGRAPRAEDPAMPHCTGAFRPTGLVLEGVSMVPLAEMLSTQRRLLGRIVQDHTGFAGPYNIEFEFDFSAANQPDYSGPSIFTALKEQLGVRLEAARGRLEVIVVESAATPGDN